MRIWVVVGLVSASLAMAGCSKPKAAYKEYADEAVHVDAVKAAPKDKPLAPSAPMMAYSYGYTVQAPAKALPDLIALQQKACVDAGPTQCQVVSSRVGGAISDSLTGTLVMRAAPAWLSAFRGRLPAEAQAAGGKVIGNSVESEDLTRQIVDTEAAVRATTTLRDRLQAMLASRPGKLSDLLEVEKELARVQGELDATQSELAVMKNRVETSLLTVEYQSSASFVAPRGAWAPLINALRNATEAFASTLGAMFTFIIIIAPWATASAVLLWLFRGPIRRWRAKRSPKPS